jgi:hypothetical protein
MFLESTPTLLLGVALATWLRHRYDEGVDPIAGEVLGGALIAGRQGLTAKSYVQFREVPEGPFRLRRHDRIVAVGLFGGFAIGLTSVGSWVFFGLTLCLRSRCAPQRSSGQTSSM